MASLKALKKISRIGKALKVLVERESARRRQDSAKVNPDWL